MAECRVGWTRLAAAGSTARVMTPCPPRLGCSRRLLLSGCGALGLQAAQWGAMAALSGCAGDPGTGRRVMLETWLDVADETTFENALGFEVTLSKAELGVEHLYFVTGDSVGGTLSQALFIREAHAHPGHYSAGDTLGEMNEPSVLDLLGDPRLLSTTEGITGEARSCVIRFGHLADAELAVRVEGEAVRDEQRVRFVATARLDELLNSASDLPEVPGVVVNGGHITTDGRLLFSALPSVWLAQVDFEQLSVEQRAAAEFIPNSQPRNAFVRGVLKAVGYIATFEETT